MKNKITKIAGVGLALMLLTSLMVFAAPVAPTSGATLSWGNEANKPKTEDVMLAPAGTNIVDIAVSGDTIYVATGASTTANITYKSTDGGQTWASLYTSTKYPKKAVMLIAVAPDDADVVGMVTSDGNTYYSTKGGSSWSSALGAPATGYVPYDMDVSPAASGVHYMAIAAANATGAAELYTLKLDIAQTWKARVSTANGAAPDQTSMRGVKFSPNFGTDKIITCVSENGTNSVWFQVFRYETGAFTWNGSISFFNATDWGAGIAIQGSLDSWADNVTMASISLIDSYLGTDEGERIAFVGVAGNGGHGGAVRVVDSYAKEFDTWSAGAEGPISSVAYHESGKLLAGDSNANQVYVGLSPMATAPKFERINNLKQPGGATNTLVAWSGDTAVAGTSGDESAFAISTDDGYAFNDISLIDTVLSVMSDVAVNADGTKIYLTTYNGTEASVWVKASSWKRVLSLSATTTLLVRIAPDDDSVVYVADVNSQDLWVSKDSGMTKWKSVPCYKLGTGDTVRDLVVESADVAYVIDDDGVSKTSSAGASWGAQKRPDDAVTMQNITLAPNNDILVGCTTYVAFSKDGGATFTRTKAFGKGTVFPVADDGYADNNIVYAASTYPDADGGPRVTRGKADDSTTPGNRSPSTTGVLPFAANHTAVGIAQHEGVVYALTAIGGTVGATDNTSHLWRALNLETAATGDLALWSRFSKAYALNRGPQALKMSPTHSVGVRAWAIDAASNNLRRVTDPIALSGPTLIAPADGDSIPVNPATGKAYNVTFTWERYSDTDIKRMQMQIATDANFDGVVYTETFGDNTPAGDTIIDTDTIAKVVGPTGATAMNQMVDFMPGKTYYWRVRVAQTGPAYSAWSASRGFSVEASTPFAQIGPVKGATGVSVTPTFVWAPFEGAIGYEIMVAEDKSFAIIDWSRSVDDTFYQTEEPLAFNTTYYWRVRGVTGPAPAKKAAPGGPWVVGVFTTTAKPVEAAPPVVITEPAPPAPPAQIVQVPVPQPTAIPPYLLWTVIIIGAVLIIALIVLIVRTRRVA